MNVQSLPVNLTTLLSIYFAEMPRVNKGVIEKWAISFSLFHKVDSILSSNSRRPISLGFRFAIKNKEKYLVFIA